MNLESAYPLSPLQHGMLYHALAAPGTGVDIEQMVCTLREAIDPAALRAAWRQVSARHPILRTAFRWDEEPIQQVWANADAPWREEDWSEAESATRESRLTTWLHEDRRRGFAMDEAPLMRLALLHFGAGESRLVWTFHHALLDGRSFPIVLREVFALYAALRAGTVPDLPLPRPYRHYIDWLQTRNPSASEPFWRETLRGFTAPTPLAIERLPGLAAESSQGDCEARLSAATTTALRDLAAAHDLTLNTLVQGAWSLLLSRYSGEDDIVFGATLAGRHSTIEGADEMVGLFINTLPVRVRLAPDAALIPWLRELRAQWTALRDHQHTPLASVQAWSGVPGGQPLFGSIVVFENYELNSILRAPGGGWEQRDFRLHEQTCFALTLAACAGPELCLRLAFDRARFDSETIVRLLGHLRVILGSFAADPHQTLRDVPLLTDAERHQLLTEWNTGDIPDASASDPALHEIFAAQAARTPAAIALTCENEHVTYRELDDRAERLAGHLRSLGVGPDVIVGLCMERSIELVTGLLAILKAGGAYLPIDLSYPPERLAFMLADAQAPMLLTQSHLTEKLPAHTAQILCIDRLPPSPLPPSAFRLPPSPSSLAYVIYTSGSTGRPKGVEIPHRALTNFLTSMQARPGITAADTLLAVTTLCFDIAGLELFLPLVAGARVVIASRDTALDPALLAAELSRHAVTIFQATPATWRSLLDSGWPGAPGLKALIGGEALPANLVAELLPRVGELWNMYGPTETTIWSTIERINSAQPPISIGRPIANTTVHLVDSNRQPVPIGVPGELLIGGAGLARGYLGRPELTAEKFIAHPFDPTGDARLYRTGDLARWLPDGRIECLGRIDHQVKIRGFRIELGEIEAVLAQHPAVREAAVIARDESAGEKRLIGYLVTAGEMPAAGDLRAHLQSKLPDYMVPAAFIALDRLPLTANGKLDRRALPAPEPARSELASRYVAPRTPAERTLAAIWQRILGLERVGVHDNFYELGGHSLHMIQVHARLREALKSDISVVRMFQHPTIESLARHLESGQPAGALPAGIAARAGRQKAALARQRLITRKP